MLNWSFYSKGRRKASSFYGVNLDAWFQKNMDAEDMQEFLPDRPAATKRRWWVPMSVSFLLLLSFGGFVWGTLPLQPQLETRATTLHVYFPQDGSLSFNATTIAPPEASRFHDISVLSAECTISLMEDQVMFMDSFAEISVQGPFRLLSRISGEQEAIQSFQGKVRFADLTAQQFRMVLERKMSFGISCSTLTSTRLYWSAYTIERIEVFNSTLNNGLADLLNNTLEGITLSDLFEDLRDGFSFLDQRQALAVLLKLPMIRDTSGFIEAVYVHLPEISFDLTLGFLGDFSVRDPEAAVDPSQAVVTFGSYPVSWLLIAQNQTSDNHAQAHLFVSCVQRDCVRSIRAVIGVGLGGFTTHPIQGVAVSATASTTSAPFFTRLLGDRHMIVVSSQQYQYHGRRVATALAGYSDCVKADMFENWRLQLCADTGGILTDMSSGLNFFELDRHPSAILVLASRNYFDYGQGNPLLLVHLNVTTLRKFTAGEARAMLGADVARAQGDSEVVESTFKTVSYIEVQENDKTVVQSYLDADLGLLQDKYASDSVTTDTPFFAMRVKETDGTMVWEFLISANRTTQSDSGLTIYKNTMISRLRDVTVFDWGTAVQSQYSHSSVSFNYYEDGRKIWGRDSPDSFELTYTTALQLGSGAVKTNLGAKGQIGLRAWVGYIENCSDVTCSNVFWVPCDTERISKAGLDCNVSLDGWLNDDMISIEAQVFHDSVGETYRGSDSISVITSNEFAFDWSNDYHHNCSETFTLDDVADTQYYPFKKQVRCSLTADYTAGVLLGSGTVRKSLDAGGRFILNNSEESLGSCHRTCYDGLVSKEQALDPAYTRCYTGSGKLSQLNLSLSMDGLRNNLDAVGMQLIVAGSFLDYFVNVSSLFSVSQNSEPWFDWSNLVYGKYEYVDQWYHTEVQNSNDYTNENLYNHSLQGFYSTNLQFGPPASRQRLGSSNNLSWSSYQSDVSKCTEISCQRFSSFQAHLDADLKGWLNDKNVGLTELMVLNVTNGAWNAWSVINASGNELSLLNWRIDMDGANSNTNEYDSTYEVGVSNYSTSSLDELLVSASYTTALEVQLSANEKRNSLAGSGRIDLLSTYLVEEIHTTAAWGCSLYPNGTVISCQTHYWVTQNPFISTTAFDLSMDGLWNDVDRIGIELSSLALRDNNMLLNSTGFLSATSNSESLLTWSSSLITGYVPALRILTTRVINTISLNAKSLIDVGLEGIIALQDTPRSASLAISNAGESVLYMSGDFQDEWLPGPSKLVCTSVSVVRIPSAQVDLRWTHTFQVEMGQEGMYSVSFQIVDSEQHVRSQRLLESTDAILLINTSVGVQGASANTLQDFVKNFAMEQTGLLVDMNVVVGGSDRLSVSSFLGSSGDMEGSKEQVSCVQVDVGIDGWEALSASGDVRMTGLKLRSLSPNESFATLQHVMVEARHNNDTMLLQRTNDVYQGSRPTCNVVTAGRLLMFVDMICQPGYCKDQSGYCLPCSEELQEEEVMEAPVSTTPLPPPPPPPPPAQVMARNDTLARATSTVTTVITTTTAIAASSVAVSAVASAVLPSLSSAGASGAGGRSGSLATSLILQTQFIAITGQIGGNSSTGAVSEFSSQLGWSNYKFFSLFKGDTNTTCDRAKQSSNELFSTLIACSGTLALAAVLRVTINQVGKFCRNQDIAMQDSRAIPFPKWELALSLTQVQGLALATTSAMASQCLLYIILGAVFFLALFLEVLSMFRLAWQAKRGKILWQTKMFHDAWMELKHDMSELKKEKKVATVSHAISTPFIRGNWNVDGDPERHDQSQSFMSRFGILIEEVCSHAWWFSVYSIGTKVLHALIINLTNNETARSSSMTACILLDLVLIVIFTPQIDWRDWVTQLLAALGNLGICLTFFLRNLDKINDAQVNSMFFAFVVISIMPMVLASLAKDMFKASGAVFQFVTIFKLESKEEEDKQRTERERQSMPCQIVECVDVQPDKQKKRKKRVRSSHGRIRYKDGFCHFEIKKVEVMISIVSDKSCSFMFFMK
ncbi:hypothetical protein GUITHDRAFT_103976 [Guillardia theta CCMP2712]|uniref:Uncharacterized protein n=1 Tax=Guillardia theta (strain CCMP2712) TaxID=905079 RepID=L1JNJ7_GUITC|nr:hypothetical protein GUITHDRAFT_103976 [Guillardia theta CCMP2712]EKX50161.1 hypothetical protein GUITHDRAFT_103976 [Guillardia theta CCMP2712]|eukprot:XP_005837141.1 hypothetical protein GUITHDRAFT_103976 [Guillardia theta CCMP2712]